MQKNIIRIVLVTAFILLIPLVAMQFTDGVVWDLTDFIVAGVLLFGAGLVYEFLASRTSNSGNRVIIGIAVFILLALTWAELAVGIFGTPLAGS